MSSALTERITGKDLLVTSILCLGNLMLLLNCSLDCNLNVCQSTFKGLRRLFSERDVHNEFCVTQQYSWKNWLPFLFPALLKHTLFPALCTHDYLIFPEKCETNHWISLCVTWKVAVVRSLSSGTHKRSGEQRKAELTFRDARNSMPRATWKL